MITVRSFSPNGPYFPPTQGCYAASSLKEMLFHTRLCMEDQEMMIGIFDENNQCKGLWQDEAEPEPDGEGDWTVPRASYRLYRPGEMSEGMWRLCINKFRKG